MPAPHTEVVVAEFPMCDICKDNEARYDGKTIYGPWANMCPECFKAHGIGLGLGRGQKLIKKEV